LNFLNCYFNCFHFLFSLNILKRFHYQLSWLLLFFNLIKVPVNYFFGRPQPHPPPFSIFLLYICVFVVFCIYFWNVLKMFGASHEWVRHQFFLYHTCQFPFSTHYCQFSFSFSFLSIFICHPLIFSPHMSIFFLVLFVMIFIL
jgi:hypothetical protein